MNCAEVDRILDSQGSDALTPKHQRAVDEHLASCRDCREAWAAYRRLIAEPVPVTPRELRHRVMGALLAARQAEPRAARPVRLGVGIVLLAGAAAASTWVYRVFEEGPAVSSVVVDGDRAPTAAPSPDTGAAPAPLATGPSAEPRNDGAEVPSVVPTAGDHPLDAYSVVVLAMPSPTISQEAAGYFEQCHEDAASRAPHRRWPQRHRRRAGFAVSRLPSSTGRDRPRAWGGERVGTQHGVRHGARADACASGAWLERIGSCDADLIDVQTSAGRVIAGDDSSRGLPISRAISRRTSRGACVTPYSRIAVR